MAVLRYTSSAENDLIEAWVFIAEDNLRAADHLVEVIDLEARQLLENPRMGRERPELGELRSWPTTTPYILFYQIDGVGIIVVRILHHARDTEAVTDWPRD